MRVLRVAVILTAVGASSSVFADDVKDYGEYLSGECTSCHLIDGTDNGIPPIVGWDPDAFTAVLQSYKSGDRENPAMVSVAKSLDDEQMKALATYFGSILPKDEQ